MKLLSAFRALRCETCDAAEGPSGGLGFEDPVAMQSLLGDDLSFITQGFGAKLYAVCGASAKDFENDIRAAFGGTPKTVDLVRNMRKSYGLNCG